jgi:hypothetical protein
MTRFWWVEFVTRRCDIQKRIRNASTLYEELEYLGSVAETERVCETQSSPPNHSHLIFRTIHSPVRYNVILHTHILIKFMKQLKNRVPLSCNKKMRQRFVRYGCTNRHFHFLIDHKFFIYHCRRENISKKLLRLF